MNHNKCMLFTIISFSFSITLLNSMEETSPLHIAAEHGDNNYLLHLLIDRGSNANTKVLNGSTPLHSASYHGHIETARLLLHLGAIPDAKNNLRFTPLHYAAQRGHTALVKLLLTYGINQSKTKSQKTPLHLAAYNGNDETARVLLNHGANPNSKSKKRKTPFHNTSIRKLPKTIDLIVQQDTPLIIKRVRKKIIDKIQSSIEEYRCATKLLVNAIKQFNYIDLCSALSQGAIINMKIDDYGNTPLHLATSLGIEHKTPNQMPETIRNIIIILLAFGANPTIKNKFDQNAIHLAAQSPTILAIYIRAATVTAPQLWKTIRINNKKTVAALLKYAGVPEQSNLLHETDPSGNNALHIAARQSFPSIVQLLLNYGADKTRLNHRGKTALALVKEHQSIQMYCKLYPLLYATSITQ